MLFLTPKNVTSERPIALMPTLIRWWEAMRAPEGAWIGKWHTEQKEALMKQILEVWMWRKVRGPAGAILCETRDLGIKWRQWHSLIFEGQVKVDMRYVCPTNVKKMLLKQARSTYRKKWAAKHEYEESKEGIWLEPALALLRRRKRGGTDKHRHVARKLFLGGSWVQKRLFDIGWSNESKCQACHRQEGTEKQRLCHCPESYEVRRRIPDAFRKWEQKKNEDLKGGMDLAKRYRNAPFK